MNLHNTFLLLLGVFITLFLAIAVSIILTNDQMTQLKLQNERAQEMIQGAYDLAYVSNDYLMHPDEMRPSIQWNQKNRELIHTLSQIDDRNRDIIILKSRISDSLLKFKEIYMNSMATIESQQISGNPIDSELIRMTWARLQVRNQGIIFDAYQLSEYLNEESNRFHTLNNVLILTLLGVFLCILIIFYLFVSRKILSSLRVLSAGARIIGSGNLDFRMSKESDDEIGDLIENVNQMSSNLQVVTASVDELEHEISVRKQVEESLQKSEMRFRDLFEHMSSGVVIYQPIDNGTDFIIIAFNSGCEQIEGISRDQVIGRRVTEVFPGVREFGILDVFSRVYATDTSEYFPEAYYQDARDPGSWRENWVYKMPSGEIVAIYHDITERKLSEEQIHESEERFRVVAMNTPDIISVQDQDLRYEWVVNPGIGLSAEEMVGKTDYNITDPEQAEIVSSLKNQVMASGIPLDLTIPLHDDAGNEYIYEGSYTPRRDSNGIITGIIGYFRDVTQQKHSEDLVKKSEIRFRRLFESAKDGILIIDYTTQKIVQANPYIEILLGYEPSELIGKTLWELSALKNIFESKKMFEVLQQEEYVKYDQIPLQSKTGSIREVEFVSNVYLVDDIKVIQCNIRDITDRVAIERALKESEQRFRYAIETGEFGVWKLDVNTGFITYSPRFISIFGEEDTRIPWTVQTFLDHVFPDDRDRIQSIIVIDNTSIQSWDFVCRVCRPDGDVRWIWVKGTPEPDYENKTTFLFGLIQDITEQKRSEEELALLNADLERRVQERTLQLEQNNATLESEIIQRTIAEETLLQTLSILHATLESTEDGLLVIDNSGQIINFNNQFLAMWKIPDGMEQAPHTSHILDYLYSQLIHADSFIYKIQEVYATSFTHDFDTVELKDGRIIEWYSHPQLIGEEVAGRVWSFRDVTVHKRMEQQIEKSLREKEMLLKEIHHRVKNNMQVISSLLYLQSKRSQDLQVQEILRESQNRIKSIALVHEKIYQSKDLEQIDYTDYLKKITRHLCESYLTNLHNLTLQINEDTVFLSVNKAVPCSLIVNELISNALKYAFPDQRKGTISIHFHRIGDMYTLEFQDDGVGFPDNVRFDRPETLGLDLVKGLVRQLNGTIELNQSGGTSYIVRFPA